MDRVRVGYVRYLNTWPLVEGLADLGAIELHARAPAQVIDLLESDEADVGLVSLVDAARASEPLTLIPSGMIGCDGPTLTVRLFSRVPLAQITKLHADAESHSSVALCRVLLKEVHGIEPEVVAFDALGHAQTPDEDWPDTALLIGDKVVTGAPRQVSHPHQLDLGMAWKELTGLPFVYAMWMCRSSRVDDPAVRTAAALLDRARRHNATRLGHIARTHAPDHHWPLDLASRYLGQYLRYEVGFREREACRVFLGKVARLQGGSTALRWLDGPVAAG